MVLCQTQSRSQPFVFEKDEPPVLLGENNGANPVDYTLAALNGCLTTSLIYHAAVQVIKIYEVNSTLAGDLISTASSYKCLISRH